MNVLILGSGGREHAFAWKIAQSPLCDQLFIAPGNAGTAQVGENINMPVSDFDSIRTFCIDRKIDLVLVGPEEPLVKGIVDFFKADDYLKNVPLIGPDASGARLEGSKAFAKQFMSRHNIPTAAYMEFDSANYDAGIPYLQNHELPVVIKADGLAAGKGVIICQSHMEALSEYELMIQQDKFGDAGKKVVVEQFLDGIEVSVFVLSDGKNYLVLPEAKDYKRIGEADTGNNTGGMGAVSPVPFADGSFMRKVEERIIKPTIDGLVKDGIDYRGFIFIGLMKVGDEPYVIEYNCRMGDPETEVVIPRIQNDLLQIFRSTAYQQLNSVKLDVDPRSACTIMAVSGGYPGSYEKGFAISGLQKADRTESLVFHAGTSNINGEVVTNGGRVLCVTSFGYSIAEAIGKSREVLGGIDYENMYFRRDIGYEFI